MGKSKYYRTSDIAKVAGVHPNTVRLYEELELLPPVPRDNNNYRLYTLAHMEQMRLARMALRCAFAEGNIRKRAISIVKTAAGGNLKSALKEADDYLNHIRKERSRAEEALIILRKWIERRDRASTSRVYLGRRDAAHLLDVSIDALRNWERNGLLEVPRNNKNGYRLYGQKEIDKAKVVRTLRMANYSLMAILRMLDAVATSSEADIYGIVSTPQPDEDMVYATDHWILSLTETEKEANEVIMQIKRIMKNRLAED